MSGQTEFRQIVKLYSERIYNHALRMLGNREDAEDATQDVFQRIFTGLNSFQHKSSLYTWIWRITNNVCIDLREKRSRIKYVSAGTEDLDQVISDHMFPDPEQSLLHKEKSLLIERCLSKMPAKESAAIMLFYFEQMDYRNISEVLDVPAGTVGTLLHRGRERLVVMLHKYFNREVL